MGGGGLYKWRFYVFFLFFFFFLVGWLDGRVGGWGPEKGVGENAQIGGLKDARVCAWGLTFLACLRCQAVP